MFTEMNFSKHEKRCIKNWINLFKDITSQYPCPPECNGACCRDTTITLSEHEFNNLLRQRKNLKAKLEQCVSVSSGIVAGKEINQYEFTVHPCPLLIDGKCSIHTINPIICKMYPFKTDQQTPDKMITIDACLVGIQIALDFLVFRSIVEGCSELSTEELIHFKEMIDDSKFYTKDGYVKHIQIPVKFLTPFVDYLKKSKQESLLTSRQKLIDKIYSFEV